MTNGRSYRIMGLVATGGTAVLYRAVQTSLDRVVAVKKLHHHLTTDENFTRRFALEAKAAASLDHENIVKIIDFGVEDGTYMMVMEFIDGESLKEVLEKWRQIPANLALALAHQICMGLEHAHAKGIVHRDVKPGNIMLTRAGKVKITDFGLAKLSQSPTQHTAADSILGTPLYMSPEQAFGESVDHRSDIFSLGTVLYECLTGRQPFQGESYMGVIQNIIHQNAPHPSRFGVELPDGVRSIVGRAMSKNRESRFQSARDMRLAIEKHLGLDALKQATDGLKALLSTDGATMMLPRTERARTTSRRARRAFAVVSVAACVSAVVLTAYFAMPAETRARIAGLVARAANTGRPAPPESLSGLAAAGVWNGFEDVVFADSLTSRGAEASGGENPAPVVPADSLPAVSVPADVSGSAGLPAPPKAATDASSASAAIAADAPVTPRRKGWLSVTSDPAARVYVNDRYIGDTPLTRIELAGGSHTLECRGAGCEPYRETLQITPGEISSRGIVLERLVGRITLYTIAGAEVLVDGALIGVTPLDAPIELEAGRHQITIKKAGFHVWNNTVTLEARQLLPLRISLSPIY